MYDDIIWIYSFSGTYLLPMPFHIRSDIKKDIRTPDAKEDLVSRAARVKSRMSLGSRHIAPIARLRLYKQSCAPKDRFDLMAIMLQGQVQCPCPVPVRRYICPDARERAGPVFPPPHRPSALARVGTTVIYYDYDIINIMLLLLLLNVLREHILISFAFPEIKTIKINFAENMNKYKL